MVGFSLNKKVEALGITLFSKVKSTNFCTISLKIHTNAKKSLKSTIKLQIGATCSNSFEGSNYNLIEIMALTIGIATTKILKSTLETENSATISNPLFLS